MVMCCFLLCRHRSPAVIVANHGADETPSVSEPAVAALIFDCDGTMVDTETPYMTAFNQALAQMYRGDGAAPAVSRRSWGRDCSGRGLEYDSEYAVANFDLNGTAAEFLSRWKENFAAMTARPKSIRLLNGFDKLYTHAKRMGLKVAVASSCDGVALRKKLENGVVANSRVVSALDAFDVILSNDNVTRHKPDPEIYLAAARELGVRPEACWVVEDSNPGVMAGKSAGMHVIAVPNVYTRSGNDFSKADFVLRSMAQAVGVLAAVGKESLSN